MYSFFWITMKLPYSDNAFAVSYLKQTFSPNIENCIMLSCLGHKNQGFGATLHCGQTFQRPELYLHLIIKNVLTCKSQLKNLFDSLQQYCEERNNPTREYLGEKCGIFWRTARTVNAMYMCMWNYYVHCQILRNYNNEYMEFAAKWNEPRTCSSTRACYHSSTSYSLTDTGIKCRSSGAGASN